MAVTLPSVSSTAGNLNAPGVGSGLDIKGLVSQLMAVEQQPLALLDRQEATFQSKLTGLGTIKSALASLQSAAQALASASAVQYSAAASDTSVLNASATSDAISGTYNVSVTQLAQSQKLLAAGKPSTTAAIGTGADTTVTFTFGTIDPTNGFNSTLRTYNPGANFTADTGKASFSLKIDNTSNTLSGIRDAINAANAGITASIINDGGSAPYRLAITSKDTGASNSLQITVSGDATISSLLSEDPTGTQNLQQTQTAQNAQLSIDGVSISSASNSVANALQGVTLNLASSTLSGDVDSPVTVTVQRDSSSLSASLNALVKAYNDANKAIAGVTGKGAVLQGDWGVLGLQNQVRSILGSVQATGGAYTSLIGLGVAFQKDGTLTVDSNALSAALAGNPKDAASLTSAVSNAIATAAQALLGAAGPISNEMDGINRSVSDIGSRRTAMQHRLDLIQQQYQQQFSALDTLISSMNQTSTFLTQQLANLPGFTNNSSKG